MTRLSLPRGLSLAATSAALGAALVAGAQPPAKAPVKPSTSKSSARSNPAPKGDPALPIELVTLPEGNVARYRVRERLAGKELDNDAVGETPKVSGTISLDKAGKIVPGTSGFTVELAPLTSDQSRRDNYVRRRILVTDTFPTTTLKVTEVRGLPSPLPKSGATNFQLVGDLTVKGVTRPTIWNVTAQVNGDQLKGTAATKFTFKDFELAQPRVAIVLSLADTIGLEYDFVMQRKK